MRMNTKYLINILFIVFLLFNNTLIYSQQWGSVVKSQETVQVGNQTFYIHKVVKGNTIYSLLKIYNISLAELKAANPHLGDDLILGIEILIPKREIGQAAESGKTDKGNEFFYHVVKQNETIGSIAKIYGVNTEDIVKMNNLQSMQISNGTYLKIPEIEIRQKINQTKTASKENQYQQHLVKPKETLFSIAKHYGLGIETLKSLNNISSNIIHPGDIILIPKANNNQTDNQKRAYIYHIVKPKEGLYAIARNYGISIQQIKQNNPGLDEYLAIGQEIKIPRQPNTKGYIEHQAINRKEKIEDIARDYEVSVNQLNALNPEIPDKIKKGEIIYIPLDFIESKQNGNAINQIKTEDNNLTETFFLEANKNKVFNVALMLPLYLSDVDSLLQIDLQKLSSRKQEIRSFRFIEFLEGARLAVDSLTKSGMNVNFKVYDVQENERITAQMLQNSDLRKADLIISLLFSRSFTQVSDFSKENRIPLVNVVSKRRQIIFENPYVFKISPNSEALFERAADFIVENMSDYNTIIVRNNPYQLSNEYNILLGHLRNKLNTKASLTNAIILNRINQYLLDGKKQSFMDSIYTELSTSGYSLNLKNLDENRFNTLKLNNSIKTVIYSSDSIRGVMRNASLLRNNLIIAMGNDEVFAIELFTKLNFVGKSTNYKVIGLPDWNNFNNLDIDYTQPFSLRMASDVFVDYTNSDVQLFVKKFYSAYNKVPDPDTYAFLGYDATFYFLEALYRLGRNWTDKIESFRLPLLQNQLHFEKQDQGGFENTYWNIYRQENYSNVLEIN